MKHVGYAMKCLVLLLMLLVFPSGGAYAQGNSVKGTVLGDDGPVIGATIRVKGSPNVATVSDLDGNFTIKAAKGATLQISYLGYKDKEVKVVNGHMEITLVPDAQALNEVVVVGYGQMKRADLTGSVASVGEKAIEKSVSTSIDQVLQGRAAGVQIQANTGTPGGSNTIRIRGTNSLSATSQPIFVIDGVIIDSSASDDGNSNPLSLINPSDIVSMDILKDASATAIYGSRASNGVIMITTKRGQSGEANVTYDGYVGWQAMPGELDVMNLNEYAQHYNDIANAQIKPASNNFIRPELLNSGTNWQDELYRKALMTSHNISISGGNKDITYALSAGYLDQDGIAIGSSFKRQTLRGNVDAQIKKWLKGGINFSLADSKQKTASTYNIIMTALTSQPSVAVKAPDGSFDGPEDQWMPDNPVALAEIIDNHNKKTNFRANTYLEATIIKGLTFKTELSADYNVNSYYYYQPDYKFGIKNNESRKGSWTKTNSKYWSWRNILTYANTFGKHNINAMVGQEMSHNLWETQVTSANGYLSNSATDPSAGTNDGSSPVAYQEPTSLFSYFGRAFYSYDDRYLLTATLRRDGSSKFAKGNRWGWFPSAALAWRVSNESFLKDNSVISNLKLRLGWGATGNQNVANWAYTATLATYPTPWGNGVLNANNANPNLKWETTYSTNIGIDLNLFNGRIELIADWYYKKTKDLLLSVELPSFMGSGGTNSSYGVASNPWSNVGSLRNTGLELTLNTDNIEAKGFSWRTNAIITINRNKVLSLDTPTGTLDKKLQVGSEESTVTKTIVGKPLGQFWGWKVIGRFDKPEDFYYKDENGNVKPVALPKGSTIDKNGTWIGDYIFEDRDNNGIIDDNDQTFIGNPEPKFTWGLGNTFSYKGFDLTIQFSGSYGNKLLNYGRRSLEITGSTSNLLRSVLNYARVEKIDPEGPDDYRNYQVTNPGTIMPRLYTSSSKNANNRVSDAFIEDGSYIRLQNISFSYTLPKAWLRKIYVNNVKIYCNLQNLHTWTKYKGYDPEVGCLWGETLMNGIDYGRYPSPRIYTFGLNVTF